MCAFSSSFGRLSFTSLSSVFAAPGPAPSTCSAKDKQSPQRSRIIIIIHRELFPVSQYLFLSGCTWPPKKWYQYVSRNVLQRSPLATWDARSFLRDRLSLCTGRQPAPDARTCDMGNRGTGMKDTKKLQQVGTTLQ